MVLQSKAKLTPPSMSGEPWSAGFGTLKPLHRSLLFKKKRRLSWDEASSYASGAANAEFLDLYRCRWKAEASWKVAAESLLPGHDTDRGGKPAQDILPVQRQNCNQEESLLGGNKFRVDWLLRFWSAQLLKAYWIRFLWTDFAAIFHDQYSLTGSVCPPFVVIGDRLEIATPMGNG